MGFDRSILGWTSAFLISGFGLPAAADPVEGVEEEQAEAPDAESTARVGHVKALPCRPTIACTAEIVPAGAWEVESGYSDRKAGGTNAHGGQVLVKYSATDHLQLQLATNNFFSMTPSTGSSTFFDGGFVGPKVQFNRQGEYLPIFAMSAFLGFPTKQGPQALQQTYDAYLWAYASKDIGFAHTDLNSGINVLNLAGSAKPQAVVAWSWSADIAYGLGYMTEGYGYFGGSAAIADAGWLNAISYSPVPEVLFDLGGDVGLAGVDRAYTLFVGVTFVPYRYQKGKAVPIFVKSNPDPALAAAPASAPLSVGTPPASVPTAVIATAEHP